MCKYQYYEIKKEAILTKLKKCFQNLIISAHYIMTNKTFLKVKSIRIFYQRMISSRLKIMNKLKNHKTKSFKYNYKNLKTILRLNYNLKVRLN
jgi:hypothetical protein